MWWTIAAAVASDSWGEGLPTRHSPDATGQRVELEYPDGARALDRASLGAVQHDLVDGQHAVGLVVADGTVVWLERGPCPVVRSVVDTYRQRFGLEVRGTATEVQCVDVDRAILDYRQRTEIGTLVQVERWNATLLPSLQVTDKAGEPALELQRGWGNQRPILGSCFDPGPGSVELSALVLPDGSVKKLAVKGGDEALAACVLGRLQGVAPSEAPPRRTRAIITVELAGVSAP